MAKITIDNDALQKGSQEISSQINSMQETTGTFCHVITQVGESWRGASSEAYTNNLNGYADRASKMLKVMEEFKNYIEKVNETFSKLDNDSANKIRNSF